MIKSFRLKRLLLPFKSSKFSAFSLVEMLMALLVASLLLAALAPVMTKKINEKVNFEGLVPNPTRKKIVYLTEPGVGEWVVPNGIRSYKVTTVGAGGGGGAGSSYGCVVFTTDATQQGALLGDDNKYCEHVRLNGNNGSFTIPDGINEIYVSMISGGGGGGAGSAKMDQGGWYAHGNYTWTISNHLKGDRIYIRMLGAGGGGGGVDQGGGGGGASGGVWEGNYDIPINQDKMEVVIGEGGHGGHYWGSPGKGGTGWRNGADGVAGTSGGGGGGSTSFNNGAITAFGGGGGAGSGVLNSPSGWLDVSSYLEGKLILADNALWRTCFNYGGNGRNGGGRGPCTYVDKNTGNVITAGGPSGGIGGDGGGGQTGQNGQDGTVGSDGRAYGEARGGKGGLGIAGGGVGGRGQDFVACANDSSITSICDGSVNIAGGGAGGGGAGSAWYNGSDAPTGCRMPYAGTLISIPKAGLGAGGAGGSCGWNAGGAQTGGDGGDGTIILYTPTPMFGGTGGTAGAVVPRSRIALTNAMKGGSVINIALGTGGKGGDRVIFNSLKFVTIDRAGNINASSTLAAANGQAGTASTVMFGGTMLATTGDGGLGGGYQTTANSVSNCPAGASCGGTKTLTGASIAVIPAWHGHYSGTGLTDTYAGTGGKGGASTMLAWDDIGIPGVGGGTLVAGNFSKRNGTDGSVGLGGSGSYYGGYGGKGGDGYVKIEWGIPRNLDHSDAIRYSGGGGSAGETVTKRITVSAVTNKIKYRIGEGGMGGSYNSDSNTMQDGSNGGDTSFGIDGNYGFDTIKSKGGRGGKSVHIQSTYDSNFMITALTGVHGAGGIAQCFIESNCNEAAMNTMNGKEGENNKGGVGGTSSTGAGGNGGSGTNINGFDALEFDGTRGGGAGGGGGISANNNYGKGGKGANGYIKIEYDD